MKAIVATSLLFLAVMVLAMSAGARGVGSRWSKFEIGGGGFATPLYRVLRFQDGDVTCYKIVGQSGDLACVR